MTTLNETLFSTIVHEYHNGGVQSSYGLDKETRLELFRYLIRSKSCNCINCLQQKGLIMKLDEYKALVLATRKANAEKAMSVLSATISPNNLKKEGSHNG